MTWWRTPGFRELDGIICDGAVRSGKTVAMTVGFFLWSMAMFQGQVFGICGKTIGALRRNMITHLHSWLGGLYRISESRSENKLVVSCGKWENTYYLFGGQDESACQLIQGITLAGVLLDEVALMPRSFVEQACARCSVDGSKLWFNCNPEGPEHWFYKEWILGSREKGILHLHFTMEDNPGLQAHIKRRYERLYKGVFYRRFVLGQWCLAEGLVYEFDRDRHVFDKAWWECAVQGVEKSKNYNREVFDKMLRDRGVPGGEKSKYHKSWYISVDYGTRNPFSAGLWCVTGGKAWRVGEFYHDGRNSGRVMTDEQYCDALEDLAGDKDIACIVVDPSAASLIAAIRARGRFPVRKARNDVLPGIRLVQSLLAADILRFSADCKDCIREFGLYKWGAGDVPVKENDHAMDEVRYFCSTVLRRQIVVDS